MPVILSRDPIYDIEHTYSMLNLLHLEKHNIIESVCSSIESSVFGCFCADSHIANKLYIQMYKEY